MKLIMCLFIAIPSLSITQKSDPRPQWVIQSMFFNCLLCSSSTLANLVGCEYFRETTSILRSYFELVHFEERCLHISINWSLFWAFASFLSHMIKLYSLVMVQLFVITYTMYTRIINWDIFARDSLKPNVVLFIQIVPHRHHQQVENYITPTVCLQLITGSWMLNRRGIQRTREK